MPASVKIIVKKIFKEYLLDRLFLSTEIYLKQLICWECYTLTYWPVTQRHTLFILLRHKYMVSKLFFCIGILNIHYFLSWNVWQLLKDYIALYYRPQKWTKSSHLVFMNDPYRQTSNPVLVPGEGSLVLMWLAMVGLFNQLFWSTNDSVCKKMMDGL
jgi:hypothetical protein